MKGEMKFGAILQACRERAALSQEELAEKIDRSRSDISKFENDHKPISMPTFHKWMEATGGETVMIAFMYGIDGLKIASQIENTIGA